MKKFKEIYESVVLQERILNFFRDDKEQRELYAKEVWNLLQDAYKDLGGLKGSGFNNMDDMIKNIPMWKVYKRDGEVVAVMMYKDKDGRKRVAMGARDDRGKLYIASQLKEEFKRAYFEVSGPSYGFIKKQVGVLFLRKYVKTIDEVKKILPNDEIVPYLKWLSDGNPRSDKVKDQEDMLEYFYVREIGGKFEPKIMLGTSGKKIIEGG